MGKFWSSSEMIRCLRIYEFYGVEPKQSPQILRNSYKNPRKKIPLISRNNYKCPRKESTSLSNNHTNKFLHSWLDYCHIATLTMIIVKFYGAIPQSSWFLASLTPKTLISSQPQRLCFPKGGFSQGLHQRNVSTSMERLKLDFFFFSLNLPADGEEWSWERQQLTWNPGVMETLLRNQSHSAG